MSAPPAFPPGKETDKAYWAARLLKYYSVRNPTQATPEQVNTVLVKFEKAGYPKMWDLLLTKYGPEPMEETPAGAPAAPIQQQQTQGAQIEQQQGASTKVPTATERPSSCGLRMSSRKGN